MEIINLCCRVMSNIGLLKLFPSVDARLLDYMASRYAGVIIESFGVGGLPTYDSGDFRDAIAKWTVLGKTFVMATQVTNEGSNMSVYEVGKVFGKPKAFLKRLLLTRRRAYKFLVIDILLVIIFLLRVGSMRKKIFLRMTLGITAASLTMLTACQKNGNNIAGNADITDGIAAYESMDSSGRIDATDIDHSQEDEPFSEKTDSQNTGNNTSGEGAFSEEENSKEMEHEISTEDEAQAEPSAEDSSQEEATEEEASTDKTSQDESSSKTSTAHISNTGTSNSENVPVESATSVNVTTVSQTTVAPTTTVIPTTVAPTTVAPTTVAPTTVAPTTVAPTTVAPTTVAPTTVAPTTVAPTTVAPTTVAPTTEPSTTAESVVTFENGKHIFQSSYDALSKEAYNTNMDIITAHLNKINSYRTEIGLNALVLDYNLSLAAGYRGVEMTKEDFFSHGHLGDNDYLCFKDIVGFYGDYSYIGENIFMATGAQYFPSREEMGVVSAEKFYESTGHRANILNENYTKVGIGVYIENDILQVVEIFAAS